MYVNSFFYHPLKYWYIQLIGLSRSLRPLPETLSSRLTWNRVSYLHTLMFLQHCIFHHNYTNKMHLASHTWFSNIYLHKCVIPKWLAVFPFSHNSPPIKSCTSCRTYQASRSCMLIALAAVHCGLASDIPKSPTIIYLKISVFVIVLRHQQTQM